MLFTCLDCGQEFKTNSALKSHKSRNRSEFDRPLCVEKLQRKRQRQQLNSMSKEEVCQAVNQMNTYDSISDKYVEGKSEIESLRKEIKKLQSIQEHIRLLKKLNPDLLKKLKPSFTTSLRLNIAGKQGWKCAICISQFTGSDFDIDHKVRWNDSFDNTESNLQALCVGCHRQKTASENTHS